MILLRRKPQIFLALALSMTLLLFGCIPGKQQVEKGNGINVILAIGDGMG